RFPFGIGSNRRLRFPRSREEPEPDPFETRGTNLRAGSASRVPLYVPHADSALVPLAPLLRNRRFRMLRRGGHAVSVERREYPDGFWRRDGARRDRKSTRLNSSHVKISYAVFCLKKKKEKHRRPGK